MLNDKDAAWGKHRFKIYTVELEQGKTYRFDHRDGGDKISPLLILEDPDGDQLESEGGKAEDAFIVYKAAKSGAYRLVVTTGQKDLSGKFILEVAPETDPKLLKEADLKFQIDEFLTLTPAQQKGLVSDVTKRLVDKDGDLSIADARLAMKLAMAAEDADVELARAVYKEAVKQFSAARDEKIAEVTPEFEQAMRGLDRLGKTIEISGKTLAGKEFDLKNLKGKVVLVDFWGTWCGPCVAEVPNMLKAHEKYHKRGFEIIGIARDKNDAIVEKFMKARNIPWACINIADSSKLIEMHGVKSYPTVMLVDRDGRIVSMRARGPQLDRLLARLLDEKKK
jgi:thiol-disulfide isomerase/thioredoxin